MAATLQHLSTIFVQRTVDIMEIRRKGPLFGAWLHYTIQIYESNTWTTKASSFRIVKAIYMALTFYSNIHI